MQVKNESEVAQSCPTLSDPMDCSLPGSSVHGIFQARALEQVPSPSPVNATVYSILYGNLAFGANWKGKNLDKLVPHELTKN